MGSARGIRAFVRRLEDRIADDVAGGKRVVLAYSGGLPSTLLAMVARKRCDLECIVAGAEGSPDVRAARTAKDYLDYRVEYVFLGSEETDLLHERVASAHPRLRAHDIRSLIPLQAVRERMRGIRLISGFGSPRLHPDLAAALRRMEIGVPLAEIARRGPLPRKTLRDAATSLGLPSAWARVPHRAPAAGAGIEAWGLGRHSGR